MAYSFKQSEREILTAFAEKVRRERHRPNDPYLLDDAAPITTNRGNKLNRNAQRISRGQLHDHLFKDRISYNGHELDIISRNPPHYTPDGDEVADLADVEEGDEPLEENIYKDVKLEEIFKPLSSAAELCTHPGMAHAYTEPGLDAMIKDAEEQLHNHQRGLWKAKNLASKFYGDMPWAPAGSFGDEEAASVLASISVVQTTKTSPPSPPLILAERSTATMNGVEGAAEAEPSSWQRHAGSTILNGVSQTGTAPIQGTGAPDHGVSANGASAAPASTIPGATEPEPAPAQNVEVSTPSHRMTTRRQANNTRTPSPVQDLSSDIPAQQIDPFFSFPQSIIPDRNYGLPAELADACRTHLSTYIARQEECVRQLEELQSGLLLAKRMRQTVWDYCRAEAHVGEMSDNEDWVDLERWGIDPRDTRIKYTKGQQEDEQVDEEEERRGKRVRRAGRTGKD